MLPVVTLHRLTVNEEIVSILGTLLFWLQIRTTVNNLTETVQFVYYNVRRSDIMIAARYIPSSLKFKQIIKYTQT